MLRQIELQRRGEDLDGVRNVRPSAVGGRECGLGGNTLLWLHSGMQQKMRAPQARRCQKHVGASKQQRFPSPPTPWVMRGPQRIRGALFASEPDRESRRVTQALHAAEMDEATAQPRERPGSPASGARGMPLGFGHGGRRPRMSWAEQEAVRRYRAFAAASGMGDVEAARMWDIDTSEGPLVGARGGGGLRGGGGRLGLGVGEGAACRPRAGRTASRHKCARAAA